MATFTVTEFSEYPTNNIASLGALVGTQSFSFTGTAGVSSAAFGVNTKYIRVRATADCALVISSTASAAITDLPLSVGAVEYFGVAPGQKISAIAI